MKTAEEIAAMDELIARLRKECFYRTDWHEPQGEIEIPVPDDMSEWDGVQSRPINPDGPEAATALEALRAERDALIAELSAERIRNGGIERLAERVRSLATEVMDLERVSAAQAMEELAVAVDVLAPRPARIGD